MQDVSQYIEKNRKNFVDDLVEFLSIPSVSAQPEHQADVRKAGLLMRDKYQQLGFKTQLFETPLHPVIYAERMEDKNLPTILFYAHYDVQPPDPLDLWVSAPFNPRIEGDSVFARGASDDKGQMFIHLEALQSFIKTRGQLPVNVKVILEGEEEIGSRHFLPFVREHTDLLACDCSIISDTDMWAPGVPALARSLRGLAGVEVELKGPNRDLHSGGYGGSVPNPINLLCALVAKLHDEQGRVTIPGFYDDVQELSEEDRRHLEELKFDEEEYRKDLGLKALWGEDSYSALERRWVRPTLDCNGITGGYQGPGSKTVIPSVASVKITMRMVPFQDPDKILAGLKSYLQSLCPPSTEITIHDRGGTPAVLLPMDGPFQDAARSALKKHFGRQPVETRIGGSIPVAGEFTLALKVPCIMMGFGLPDDNLHSPNEKFSLTNYHQGILTVAEFLEQVGRTR